jgi:hypothetical protein
MTRLHYVCLLRSMQQWSTVFVTALSEKLVLLPEYRAPVLGIM